MNSFCVSAPVKSTSIASLEPRVSATPFRKATEVADFRTLDASELQIIGGGDIIVNIR
jgi:hypothetical protein